MNIPAQPDAQRGLRDLAEGKLAITRAAELGAASTLPLVSEVKKETEFRHQNTIVT